MTRRPFCVQSKPHKLKLAALDALICVSNAKPPTVAAARCDHERMIATSVSAGHVHSALRLQKGIHNSSTPHRNQ